MKTRNVRNKQRLRYWRYLSHRNVMCPWSILYWYNGLVVHRRRRAWRY